MARSFLTPIDLNGLELLNVRLQNLATDPSSPTEGRIYYNTTVKNARIYSGSTNNWVDVVAGVTGYTDEQAQDAINALIAAGTQSGLSVTYNDASNSLSFTVPADGAAGTATLRTLGTGATQAAAGNHTHVAANVTDFQTTVSANTDVAANTAARHTHSNKAVLDATTASYTTAEQSKLAGVATGATNYTDTNARANRLDQFAAPTASVSMNNQLLTNVLAPVSGGDAVNKTYADGLRSGVSVKDPVAVATTANITLSGLQTIDGYTTVANDRVLVKNQTTGSQNGIYVAASGAWTRATDADSAAELAAGTAVWVQQGGQGNSRWVQQTTGTITLGTTSLTFVMDFQATSATAGNGLTASGSVLAVGAGTGISVAADTVSIDPAVVVRKYAADVGDGTSTTITVTHNLNTRDVEVQVYRNSTPWDTVEPEIQRPTVNTVALVFPGGAPTAAQYRAVVQG